MSLGRSARCPIVVALFMAVALPGLGFARTADQEAAAIPALPAPDACPIIITMPATGAEFSLPPDPELEDEACKKDEPVRPAPPDIFGLSAIPANVHPPGSAWDAAQGVPLKEMAGPWTEVLNQSGSFPVRQYLAIVNSWANWHLRFEEDGAHDSWSSPLATFKRGSGDCEDFAMAKMTLLENAGIRPEDMFLILVRERERPVDHAVLAVRNEQVLYVLDNRTDAVMPADTIRDYIPLQSFSGKFGWIYGYRIDAGTSLPTTFLKRRR